MKKTNGNIQKVIPPDSSESKELHKEEMTAIYDDLVRDLSMIELDKTTGGIQPWKMLGDASANITE